MKTNHCLHCIQGLQKEMGCKIKPLCSYQVTFSGLLIVPLSGQLKMKTEELNIQV